MERDRWEVQVTGDTHLLSILAETLRGDAVVLAEREGEYVLRARRFEALDDAREVRNEARALLEELRGMCRALEPAGEIALGSVYQPTADGGRSIYVHPVTVGVRAGALLPSVTVTRADGTVERRTVTDPIRDWLARGPPSDALRKALRLLSEGPLGWVELYRIYEVVETAVGPDALGGWISRKQRARFKHTANSVGAVGDAARHGVEHTNPPASPMTLDEARAMVMGVVRAWLDSQGDSTPVLWSASARAVERKPRS